MSKRVIHSGASPQEVAADLAPLVDFQEAGLPLDELNRLLQERLAPHLMRYDRPEFHSMYNAFLEEGSALGARLALTYNQGVTNWQISPGAATLEELCCQALCRLFGLAPTADATFMLAGTYANQQALYQALHRKAEDHGFDFTQEGLMGFEDPGRLAVLMSREAHFSLQHAVRTMGLGEQCLVAVEVDEERRMDVGHLRETLDRLRGRKEVFCVVSTAGTTSTGSIDPILPLVEICREAGAWLHVDGAYGLIYSLLPEWKPLFAGMGLADSVSWDPHKQFRVPIPSSVFFNRRRQDFGRMALYADYFNREGEVEPNPGLKSMPSTRPFAALNLVTSLRHQGLEGVRQNLRAPLEAIRAIAAYIDGEPGLELCHQPDTGILCFRITPAGMAEDDVNRLQKHVYDGIMAGGERTIAMTKLDGRRVLRFLVISPRVSYEDLKETISVARALAQGFGLAEDFLAGAGPE